MILEDIPSWDLNMLTFIKTGITLLCCKNYVHFEDIGCYAVVGKVKVKPNFTK